MAKKAKNNSINLLKGITGSKLAKLLTIAAIVLAIPLTVFMSQKQQNTTQEASLDSGVKPPIVTSISAEAREIVTWTDGTKRTKVWLRATAYDPNKGKVQVAFRIRAKGNCVNPLTSSWTSDTTASNVFTYGAANLQIGKVYEFSAKARKVSNPVYSNGLTFCDTTGWYSAKSFYVNSKYQLIKL